MTRPLALAATLAIAAVTSFALPAVAQDFNCNDARSATERAICSSHSLKQLDEAMAQVYGRIWGYYGRRPFMTADRLSLQDQQRDFLAARDSCGSNTRCIRNVYNDHIGQLTSTLRSAKLNAEG